MSFCDSEARVVVEEAGVAGQGLEADADVLVRRSSGWGGEEGDEPLHRHQAVDDVGEKVAVAAEVLQDGEVVGALAAGHSGAA